jgi:hypothetical protein
VDFHLSRTGKRTYSIQAIAALLLVAQSLSLMVDIPRERSRSDYRLVSSITTFTATLSVVPLAYMEHMRSTRPADLIVVFLLASLACDGAVAAASISSKPSGLLFGAKAGLKLLLVAAESRGKASVLATPYANQSPEQLGGILNRTFFWWINPLLALGNRMILTGDALPPIDDELRSKRLRCQALRAWDQRTRPECKTSLPRALVRSILSHFLGPIVPRLCLIFFRYAQPVLIGSAIRVLAGQSRRPAYMLVVEAAAVYMGLAVCFPSRSTIRLEPVLTSARSQKRSITTG